VWILLSFTWLAARCDWPFQFSERENDGDTHPNTFTVFPFPRGRSDCIDHVIPLWLAEGEHHLGNWKFVLPRCCSFFPS